jgi:hypothetical protein
MSRAVNHLLRQMQHDPRLAWLIGPGSRSYELLTEEAAAANNLDIEELRKQHTATLKFERWPRREDGAAPTSVHNLVACKPLQAGAVGRPVGGAIGGHTPIVVEVYALGVGVALVREGSNLRGAQGTFELEANGKRVVIDPLRSRKTQRLVPPVQGDVAAIGLPLQAVNQHEMAQFRSRVSGSHNGASSQAKAAILSLPQGWGKTTMAPAMAAFLGLHWIVEEWHPAQHIVPGALHLTSEPVDSEGGAA